jgi:hypothetical protein
VLVAETIAAEIGRLRAEAIRSGRAGRLAYEPQAGQDRHRHQNLDEGEAVLPPLRARPHPAAPAKRSAALPFGPFLALGLHAGLAVAALGLDADLFAGAAAQGRDREAGMQAERQERAERQGGVAPDLPAGERQPGGSG